MWYKDLPHKMYVGQRPTYHDPMIMSYLDFLMQECCTEMIQFDIKFDKQLYV